MIDDKTADYLFYLVLVPTERLVDALLEAPIVCAIIHQDDYR